jgi:hypothetical protein
MAARPEILAALGMLTEVFPEGALSESATELYADALAELDAVALLAGVRRLIRDARHFPRPAEIREAAGAEVARDCYADDHGSIPLFPVDRRSLDEIADNRRAVAPLWSEVLRVAKGGELRPFDEVLADLDAGRID